MFVLRLIVFPPRSIWLTKTVVKAEMQNSDPCTDFSGISCLESSLVKKLHCKGNVKECNIPMGFRVLTWLVLTATDLASLSAVSRWVYIWYTLGFVCHEQDCSSGSLTWFLWLWMLNSVNYIYLPCVLNSVLDSSENMVYFEPASEFYSDCWQPSGSWCVWRETLPAGLYGRNLYGIIVSGWTRMPKICYNWGFIPGKQIISKSMRLHINAISIKWSCRMRKY